MAKNYTKATWADEVLSGTELYEILESDDTPIEVDVKINMTTGVTTPGTALTAARMNNIENGVDGIDTILNSVGINALAVALGSVAPLASPVFTGNPTAPTATASDNDTSIATTAFVMAQRGDINSGATVPASPYTNQLFLHTATGRRAMLIYTGSAWYVMASFGTCTYYVDKTNGTDAVDKGYGTGTSAYKTLAYAWSQIADVCFGNVTINVTAETYSESFVPVGKRVAGAYNISITGTESSVYSGTISSATAGTAATPGSIVDTVGGFGVDAYKGMMLKFGSTYRVIKNNTADTITVVGTLGSTPTGAFSVIEPGTVLDGGSYGVLMQYPQALIFYNFKFAGASATEIYINNPNANITLYRCSVQAAPTSGVAGISSLQGRVALVETSIEINGNATAVSVAATKGVFQNSLFFQGTGSKSGIGLALSGNSQIDTETYPNVFDNFATAIQATTGAQFKMNPVGAFGYPFVVNNTTGITAASNAAVTGTSANQYSGNTADETATAASYGYID